MTVTTTSAAAPARAADSPTDATRETVHQFVDAWTAGDKDQLLALLADDAVWHVARSIGEPIHGRDAVAHGLAGGAAGRFVKLETVHRTVQQIIVDGTHAMVLVELTAVTHSDQQYANLYAWHYVVEDGRVVSIDEYADTLLAARLGFLPFIVDAQ